MDAEKAKKNVELHKSKTFNNFVKDNKKRLDKILDKVSLLSKEGKREYHVEIRNKDEVEHVKEYLKMLGFGSHIIRSYNSSSNNLDETLRITW